jgi:hypothetical protein
LAADNEVGNGCGACGEADEDSTKSPDEPPRLTAAALARELVGRKAGVDGQRLGLLRLLTRRERPKLSQALPMGERAERSPSADSSSLQSTSSGLDPQAGPMTSADSDKSSSDSAALGPWLLLASGSRDSELFWPFQCWWNWPTSIGSDNLRRDFKLLFKRVSVFSILFFFD